jgi:hypothetical protein
MMQGTITWSFLCIGRLLACASQLKFKQQPANSQVVRRWMTSAGTSARNFFHAECIFDRQTQWSYSDTM